MLENTYTFVNKVTILHTCMSLYVAFLYVFFKIQLCYQENVTEIFSEYIFVALFMLHFTPFFVQQLTHTLAVLQANHYSIHVGKMCSKVQVACQTSYNLHVLNIKG